MHADYDVGENKQKIEREMKWYAQQFDDQLGFPWADSIIKKR